ncbi:MAG: DegT/DnrJ/EryC1/StrS family aminotransferase [Clostridia bacterium]|nr:DegT/DnrJ/EryC1/StrS family aminotransferase [Clostridia bacterium]
MGVLAITGGPKTMEGSTKASWPVSDRRELESLYTVLSQAVHGKNGPAAARFEYKFAARSGAAHCILCANGTVSIELILRGLNIGRGDEVIIPPYTFIATVSSIIFAGATPVFADIEPDTCALSAASARDKITPRTRAVMPVYIGGRPADLDAFAVLAEEAGIHLIGDAAQAAGSEWRGRGVGSIGAAAAFSCQNSKNLTCGEGGIITTNDGALAENIRTILGGGKNANGMYSHIGVNHNLSEWQAAILDAQLDRLDGQIAKRMENAAYLDGLLESIPCVSPLAADKRVTRNTYHLYIFRIHEDRLDGISRDCFLRALQAEGVEAAAGYAPLHAFPCLTDSYVEDAIGGGIHIAPDTPVADRLSYHEAAWLNQSVLLGGRHIIEGVADAIHKVYTHLDELRRAEDETCKQKRNGRS